MKLTPEQFDIVQAKVDAHNAANPKDLITLEELVAEVGLVQVRAWQAESIEAKGRQLVTIAQQMLTDQGRLDFTAEVESLLGKFIQDQR